MNEDRLYEAIGFIGEDILEEAEKKPSKRFSPVKKWIAAAACICIVAASALTVIPALLNDTNYAVIDKDKTDIKNDAPMTGPQTSEEYSNLKELLSYLSRNDSHGDDKADSTNTEGIRGSAAVSAVAEPQNSVVYNGYSYHLSGDRVMISELLGENTKNAGSIDFAADRMFLSGSHLVLLDSYQSGGDELNYEMSVRAAVYDLASPTSPLLLSEFDQLGSLTACYLSGETLTLMTSDGVCACGWSRLNDTSGYVPELSQNGKRIDWKDEDINILGSPTSINYVAVTQIDVASLAVLDKQAFYGDIEDVFYGGEWLAFSTASTTDVMTRPEVYTFTADGLKFTGKISTADVFGLDEYVELDDFTRPGGKYPNIRSVSKSGGLYRIVGFMLTVTEGERSTEELFVITADPAGEKCAADNFAVPDIQNLTFDDILWEDSRAVITISSYDEDFNEYSRFIFAEFSEGGTEFYDNGLEVPRCAGIDMVYWMGSPFGHLKALLPLGGGTYVRYNGIPNGFYILDFTDSSSPHIVAESDGGIPEENRLEFIWHVYDESTIGVLMLSPNSEGEYRNMTYAWRVYKVTPENPEPFELLYEVPAVTGGSVSSFEYDGVIYLTHSESEIPVFICTK